MLVDTGRWDAWLNERQIGVEDQRNTTPNYHHSDVTLVASVVDKLGRKDC